MNIQANWWIKPIWIHVHLDLEAGIAESVSNPNRCGITLVRIESRD